MLHHGALPAYIDWATFERNQEQMAADRTRYSGTPRGGAALLGGLVTCGLCMFTTYNENGREAGRQAVFQEPEERFDGGQSGVS